MPFDEIIPQYFTRRPDRIVRNLPFGDYCQIPSVNASLLREPTAYQMKCRIEALHLLPDADRAPLEFFGADTSTLIERVNELTPRTMPRTFAALVKSPAAGEKITAAQQDLCNSLISGPVDSREFAATTLAKCVANGWVHTFAKEVAEDGVSTQVRESRALAFTIGRAVHVSILEPHRFDSDAWQKHYQLSPTKGITTKAALAALAECPSRELITSEIVDTARRSRDAVWKHAEARMRLEKPGSSEVSIETWDDELQVMRKVRVDRLPDDPAEGIIDIKTTKEQNLMLEPIRGAVYRNGYHIQMAYYADTVLMLERKKSRPCYLIFVTKEAPFIAHGFWLAEALEDISFPHKGREIYLEERLPKFCLAYAESNWEAYENQPFSTLVTK